MRESGYLDGILNCSEVPDPPPPQQPRPKSLTDNWVVVRSGTGSNHPTLTVPHVLWCLPNAAYDCLTAFAFCPAAMCHCPCGLNDCCDGRWLTDTPDHA